MWGGTYHHLQETMNRSRRCGRCRQEKHDEDFDQDRHGQWKKTCRRCLNQNQVSKQARLEPEWGSELQPELEIQSRGEVVERRSGRYCLACHREKELRDFDLDPRGQIRLSCRDCWIGVRLPLGNANLEIEGSREPMEPEMGLAHGGPELTFNPRGLVGPDIRGQLEGNRWRIVYKVLY
ncbi:hypothetical protein HOY80DRAFT_1003138 [Tuber brumale]|nr:hypothetical protein HOY80DRAFT_1003138 [Tuber brumale]